LLIGTLLVYEVWPNLPRENGTVTCDSCARRELTDNDGVTVGSSMDGMEF
jgi:hypothetical protein